MKKRSSKDRRQKDRRQQKRVQKDSRQKDRRQEGPPNKQLSEWDKDHPYGHAGHPFS